MLPYLKQHKETLLVILLGLAIFGALNWMMVNVDPERFTNPHYGPWSAFKNLVVSGFDFYTYNVVTSWQPRYELYRHPLLYFYMWPLAEVNKWLKDLLGINCTIYVVGAVWTMASTTAWLYLYRIIRKVIGLPWISSLLYALLFFSFSHVMLVTFLPDHMVLTMCVLLCAAYLVATAKGKMPIWKTLLLYLLGTGITTTNSAKVWMMDMVGKSSRFHVSSFKKCFCRSFYFIIPTILIAGCGFWQEYNAKEEFRKSQDHMTAIKLRTDSTFAKRHAEADRRNAEQNQELQGKQISSSKLFAWTDNSVRRLPLLYENIFGEGLLLHENHLLKDPSSQKDPRPVIVRYTHRWYYVINSIIVILSIFGLWVGRRKLIMWIVFLPFLFDMFLHVGLRFASADAYIMTAHWAFILPVGIALLEKHLSKKKFSVTLLKIVVMFVAAFLWYHNLSLTIAYLTQI